MILAFASGKGGTGKTSVSVSCALSLPDTITFLDCDVEEPNAHFFINPEMVVKKSVSVPIPQINFDKCTGCGECSDMCQFNAIVQIKKKVMVFHELCHSCGGCKRVCPTSAITEVENAIGTIYIGSKKNISFAKGELLIGKTMSPPLIRTIKKIDLPIHNVIIDCPPGTSCPMVTAVNGADYVILVTEPTPFGLNDLKLAVDTVKELQIPFGIIINRSTNDDSLIEEYCQKEKHDILLKIPEDRKIAEAYSLGNSMLSVYPELGDTFKIIISNIHKIVGNKNNERNSYY